MQRVQAAQLSWSMLLSYSVWMVGWEVCSSLEVCPSLGACRERRDVASVTTADGGRAWVIRDEQHCCVLPGGVFRAQRGAATGDFL